MNILVTGGNGLCGSAIRRIDSLKLSKHKFHFPSRNNFDLRKADDVKYMFSASTSYLGKIDAVIHTAARVGGIGANIKYQESFFRDNIMINANVISECVDRKIPKLLAFSSVCVFPDNLTLLEEEKINDGPVYGANEAYGYAKRMVDVHIRAAKKQHGFKNWSSIIPGNIFGPNDMFSIEDGHIIPALIHKLYLAKQNNTYFVVWGDGLSLREFIYVDDLAHILIKLLDIDDIPDKIIISGRKERSIKSIVDRLVKVSGFTGKVVWDTTKPNGQRSRPSSKERIDKLLPDYVYADIDMALAYTWEWFVNNYETARKNYVNNLPS